MERTPVQNRYRNSAPGQCGILTAVFVGPVVFFLYLRWLINRRDKRLIEYEDALADAAASMVVGTIKTQQERIRDEIGFGLEQLVNLLNTRTSPGHSLPQWATLK